MEKEKVSNFMKIVNVKLVVFVFSVFFSHISESYTKGNDLAAIYQAGESSLLRLESALKNLSMLPCFSKSSLPLMQEIMKEVSLQRSSLRQEYTQLMGSVSSSMDGSVRGKEVFNSVADESLKREESIARARTVIQNLAASLAAKYASFSNSKFLYTTDNSSSGECADIANQALGIVKVMTGRAGLGLINLDDRLGIEEKKFNTYAAKNNRLAANFEGVLPRAEKNLSVGIVAKKAVVGMTARTGGISARPKK